MHCWNSIFIIDTCIESEITHHDSKNLTKNRLTIRILWSSQNFEQEILTKRLKVIRQISKSNLSIPPVIVFRVPPPITFVHQSVKQLESNANPRVHRIAQPVTSFPGCPEWSREIRCIIRAPGIRKIGLIVGEPVPRFSMTRFRDLISTRTRLCVRGMRAYHRQPCQLFAIHGTKFYAYSARWKRKRGVEGKGRGNCIY